MLTFTMEQVREMVLISFKDLLPSLGRYSDKQLVQKVGKEKFEEAVDQIVDFIESGCARADLSKNEYLALISLVLRCMASYFQDIGVPVTINNLVNTIQHLPHAVDLAYPGYARSGLLRCVISPTRLQEVALVA